MAKTSRGPKKTPPAPVDATQLVLGFVSAVGVIRQSWETWHRLFMDDNRCRFDLQANAPTLAETINLSLTITLYMLIAQLNDPEISMNDPHKRNLVLRRVLDSVAPPKGTLARDRIEAHYARMQPTLEKLKQWRNAVGAHKDLMTSLKIMEHLDNPTVTPNPLPFIPVMDVLMTVEGLVAITDEIVNHHLSGVEWYQGRVSTEVQNVATLLRRGTRERDNPDFP